MKLKKKFYKLAKKRRVLYGLECSAVKNNMGKSGHMAEMLDGWEVIT